MPDGAAAARPTLLLNHPPCQSRQRGLAPLRNPMHQQHLPFHSILGLSRLVTSFVGLAFVGWSKCHGGGCTRLLRVCRSTSHVHTSYVIRTTNRVLMSTCTFLSLSCYATPTTQVWFRLICMPALSRSRSLPCLFIGMRPQPATGQVCQARKQNKPCMGLTRHGGKKKE